MKSSVLYVYRFVFCLVIWICFVLAQDDATILSFKETKNVSIEYNNNEGIDETQNIDQQKSVSISELEPSGVEVVGSFSDNNNNENDPVFNKQVFVEATSQNSGVGNDILSSGPPVVVTLSDVATTELKQRATIPSQNNENPTNDSKIDLNKDTTTNNNQTSRSETANNSDSKPTENNVNVKENLTEEIPSFSEWAQKQLEEAEKKKDPQNNTHHHHHNNINSGGGRQGAKLRWKNYASLDCGAKVVASNPEAGSPGAILSPSRDEYKLNTCTSRIWFIVELCEAIQAKKIDLANFELFSSSPKDFTVSVSDRFPTREWSNVGQFTAKDERDIQSFDLHPHLFGKYIKVEVKSHYGSEHYCPISLFKVYGTSEFEVLQKEDQAHTNQLVEDDDDDDDENEENLDIDLSSDSSKNLFSSATDAVISMVKKAAEVLGNNKGNSSSNQTVSSTINSKYTPLVRICTSPRHLVVCDNCSDTLFGQIYGLLSCNRRQIEALVAIPIIRQTLTGSNTCHKFGLTFKSKDNNNLDDDHHHHSNGIKSFFTEQLLGAMCNTIAILENRVVLNSSKVYANSTEESISEEAVVRIETSEPHVIQQETIKNPPEITETIKLDGIDGTISKSTCSTDVSLTSQIKPTKTLSNDESINTESSSSVVVVADDGNVIETEMLSSNNITSITTTDVIEDEGENDVIGDVYSGGGVESTENLDDHLEHFINEFNGENGGISSAPTTTTTTTPTSTPQAQKESVFLRLSNRIKALERNMSLSGQYLEELSKRYKKQVEEIQKLLDKTILSMSEENAKKDERNRQLEERIVALTASVEALIAERSSWSLTIYCVVVSTLVTLFVISFCYNKSAETATARKVEEKPVEVKRRKSIDVVQHNQPAKRRRPSDQALKIVRSSMESADYNVKKNKKKKKVLSSLKRSNSINTLSEESEYQVFKPKVNSSQVWEKQEQPIPTDWVEGKQQLEEVPIVLEDSEHSSLEPLVLPDTVNKLHTPPNYFKTALTSRAIRLNGDAKQPQRKWMSVDETSRNVNGNLNNGESQTPKKEKKSFKKIFKKVF